MGRYLTVNVGGPDDLDSSSHVASYADSMKSSMSFSSSLLYTCAAKSEPHNIIQGTIPEAQTPCLLLRLPHLLQYQRT